MRITRVVLKLGAELNIWKAWRYAQLLGWSCEGARFKALSTAMTNSKCMSFITWEYKQKKWTVKLPRLWYTRSNDEQWQSEKNCRLLKILLYL